MATRARYRCLYDAPRDAVDPLAHPPRRAADARSPDRPDAIGRPDLPAPSRKRDSCLRRNSDGRHLDLHGGRHAVAEPAVGLRAAAPARLCRDWLDRPGPAPRRTRWAGIRPAPDDRATSGPRARPDRLFPA